MFDAIKRLAKGAGIAPGLSTSNNLVRAGWPASQAGARHEPRVRGPYPLFGGRASTTPTRAAPDRAKKACLSPGLSHTSPPPPSPATTLILLPTQTSMIRDFAPPHPRASWWSAPPPKPAPPPQLVEAATVKT